MSVFSWGLGKTGQLGNGHKEDSPLPVFFKLSKKAGRPRQVSSGGLFTMVLTSHGDVYVSGCSKYGRTGSGQEDDIVLPSKIVIAKDAKVAQLCAGCWHSAAITYLGRVYLAGFNSTHKVLGREDHSKFSSTPSIVPALMNITIKLVSCGHNFTLVNSEDGHVYSWGCGKYGVLGHASQQSVASPTKITALDMVPIQTISAGFTHCAAVSRDGRLFTWGRGVDGALGLGAIKTKNVLEPTWLCSGNFLGVPVSIVACSLGEHKAHTLALSHEGTVFSWGSNVRGSLGLGDKEDRYSPEAITSASFGDQSVISIAAGASHSAAVTCDGQVYTWGCGKDGKLGHKDYMDKPKTYHCLMPKRVDALTSTAAWKKGMRAVQIAASNSNTHVILDFL